jgi:hypothetical protein
MTDLVPLSPAVYAFQGPISRDQRHNKVQECSNPKNEKDIIQQQALRGLQSDMNVAGDTEQVSRSLEEA